jgi:hypothetical protein
MNILWDDAVYPFLEISEIAKPPYRVSDSFVEAVKSVIDKLFPPSLRKNDGTKILIIEKQTAVMGDLFFGHVDQVSRQLFDLSPIHEKFNSSLITSHLLTKYLGSILFFSIFFILIEIAVHKKMLKITVPYMMTSPSLFYPNLSFSQHQHSITIDNFIIENID